METMRDQSVAAVKRGAFKIYSDITPREDKENASFIAAANPRTVLQLIERYEKVCEALLDETECTCWYDADNKKSIKCVGCRTITLYGPEVPLE